MVSCGTGAGESDTGKLKPLSQSQRASRQCSVREIEAISRMDSSGSWVSIQRPVKQAATSSWRREESEGGLVVVGVFGGDPVGLGMECHGNWWGDGPRGGGPRSAGE